jgi:hypothetical protein
LLSNSNCSRVTGVIFISLAQRYMAAEPLGLKGS